MSQPLRIYFDTEFTGLVLAPRLISLGAVAMTGEVFYAELSDTYTRADCTDFVLEEVLPHLEGGAVQRTQHQLCMDFAKWLEAFERPVVLLSDAPSWDWPFIHQLYPDPYIWPSTLAKNPMLVDSGLLDALDIAGVYLAEGLRRHHALDDAKAMALTMQRSCYGAH